MAFDFHAAYEALNPDDADYLHYAGLARRLGSARVADVGCGTGVLAVLLTQHVREVIGVDPDPEMLRVARERSGAEGVGWIQGDASDLPPQWADLVTMSGHVSQVFVSRESWLETLRGLHRGLRTGGTLAFEMRNPAARAWEGWTREQTLRIIETDDGPVEFWHETRDVSLPLVTYATINRNLGSGEEQTYVDTLAFRTEPELRADLTSFGFTVREVLGDWDGSAVTPASPELILTATAD